MAVVKCQATVAHVLAVDALGSSGDADHLGLLHIGACSQKREKQYTEVSVLKDPAGRKPDLYQIFPNLLVIRI